MIVDSGFSFTHVIPYIEGKKYFKAIKRIGIGGKVCIACTGCQPHCGREGFLNAYYFYRKERAFWINT